MVKKRPTTGRRLYLDKVRFQILNANNNAN